MEMKRTTLVQLFESQGAINVSQVVVEKGLECTFEFHVWNGDSTPRAGFVNVTVELSRLRCLGSKHKENCQSIENRLWCLGYYEDVMS
jgi:hypothetical protein